MLEVRRTTRANLPSRYTFSLVSEPPPKTPIASRPYFRCTTRMPEVIVSSACVPVGRHQLAGRIAHQRRDQAFGMRQRLACREALHAEGAGVDGKVRIAGDRQRPVRRRTGEQTALKRAVGAVGANRTGLGRGSSVELRIRHVLRHRPSRSAVSPDACKPSATVAGGGPTVAPIGAVLLRETRRPPVIRVRCDGPVRWPSRYPTKL